MNDRYCTKRNPEKWFKLVSSGDLKVLLEDPEGEQKEITKKTFKKNYQEWVSEEKPEEASSLPLVDDPLPTSMGGPKTQGEPQEKPTENSMRANREAKAGEARPFKPKRPYLRQSMIQQFELDPATFYRKYEDGFQEDTIFTSTGTSVHGVMEDFFNAVKAGEYTQGEDGFKVLYGGEYLNIESFVDKSLSAWWGKYGDADYEWFATFRGHTNRYLGRVVREGLPEVIATEFEFTLEEDALGTPVSGTIDRIDRVDERTIRIVDYKTNFMPFSSDDLRNSQQFMMYTLACSALKDQLGDFDIVICSYEMVRLGYSQHVVFDEIQLSDFKVYMKMLWDKILSGTDREFRPNRFTAFSQLRSENPEYNKMLHKRITEEFDATDVEALIEERESIEMTLKTCKVRKAELDLALKSHIAEAGGEMEIGDRQYSIKASARMEYDSDKIIRYMAMNGLTDQMGSMVKFSNKQLKDSLPAPMYEQVRQQYGIVSYTNPSITSRKIKKKN